MNINPGDFFIYIGVIAAIIFVEAFAIIYFFRMCKDVKDIKKLLISNYEQEQYTKKQIEELEKENNLLKQQNQALMNAFEIKKTAQPQ